MFVTRREGETFEELYRRFRRGVEDAGVLREVRRRRHFVPEHEQRRERLRKAARNRARAARRGGG